MQSLPKNFQDTQIPLKREPKGTEEGFLKSLAFINCSPKCVEEKLTLTWYLLFLK
jgi:hypothetical protein